MKITAIAMVVLAVSTLALSACGNVKSYSGSPYNDVRTAGKGVAVYDGKGNKTYTKAQTK